jgi:hypothetical protein
MLKALRLGVMITVLLALSACANLKVVPPEERQLQKVHEINMTKNEIFDKTLEWMAQSFTDSKAVIELKDKENGKIIGKGVTTFTNVVAVIPCRFTMIVDIKDNKYRTTYNNFVGMWGQYQNQPRELKEQAFIDETITKLKALDTSLYIYLKNSKKTSDW